MTAALDGVEVTAFGRAFPLGDDPPLPLVTGGIAETVVPLDIVIVVGRAAVEADPDDVALAAELEPPEVMLNCSL